jgi:hypothetical protein
MNVEKRFKNVALILLALAIAGLFIGLSDASLGVFDFDLGWFFFGEFDNEYDVLAWLLLLATFPAFVFNVVVIYNIDLLLKKSSLGSETFINFLLIFFVPFYQLYYIYKRLDYLDRLNHPLGDKKFLYPLLAFVGLNTFAFALTHDEIISSSAYKNSNDSVFTLYTNSSNTTEIEDYDIADELAKLKKLLDDDLINQEDYDRKKEKLLK